MIQIPEDIERLTAEWNMAKDCMIVYGFVEGQELTPGRVIAELTGEELYANGFEKETDEIRDCHKMIDSQVRNIFNYICRFKFFTTFRNDSMYVTMTFPIDERGWRFYQDILYEEKFEEESK